MHPQVHDTGIALSLTHGIGYLTATLGMLYPEGTDTLIGIGERQTATLGMREAAGVEIQFGIVLLSPINP